MLHDHLILQVWLILHSNSNDEDLINYPTLLISYDDEFIAMKYSPLTSDKRLWGD